ncbi:MAG: hypothetical protein KGJ93_00315 [Patescibacteria group bacterium]|nr:hypothetical protein [Patescibacteria group bacterium]
MLKQKILKFVSLVLLLSFPVVALAQTIDPTFNPSKLIDDKVFSDTQTFGGPAGVQKFLEAKQSILASTSPDFLVKLKEPSAILLKQGLSDPEPNLPRLRTAAELIWDASVQSGLNPQVIVVTLNKEQGLITSSQSLSGGDLQRALDHAMGFACPDSSGCGDLFPGFYYQLFGNYDSSGNRYLGSAKSLMKSFATSRGRGPDIDGATSHIGDMITLDNTMGGYDGILPQQSVQLLNAATAALYRYTPHVFNGNYNFWKFFNAWFKYPNGTLIKLTGANDTYIIQNGLKQLVPQFVAQARGLNFALTTIVSPTEFDSYQTDQILGPADNTIVAPIGDSQKYVFLADVKHPASDFVIKQRGLDLSKVLVISTADSALFQSGSVLPPNDGTIIRGQQNPAVYLVQNGQLQLFSSFTFAQHKIKAKQVTLVSDTEMSTYPKSGFVPPLDGTLIKTGSNPTVYLVQNGLKQPVLADVYKNRGYSARNVNTISVDEVNALSIGPYAAPKDYTFFAMGSKTGQLMEYKEGAAHTISTFVAKQRGITPDYVFSADVVGGWLPGIPVPPRDGTIVKGDADNTVYLVSGGQLRPMTYQAYLNRRITPKRISVLPQAEVDAYAKGDILAK